MTRNTIEIEQGRLGLAVINRAAVGYTDAWQAPGGKTLANVTLADYHAQSGNWSCQIVEGALTSTPDTTTRDVPGDVVRGRRDHPLAGQVELRVLGQLPAGRQPEGRPLGLPVRLRHRRGATSTPPSPATPRPGSSAAPGSRPAPSAAPPARP